MFSALFDDRRETTRNGPQATRAVASSRPSSLPFIHRVLHSRLTFFLLALSSSVGSLAVAGCGGLAVNNKVSSLSALSCSNSAVSGGGTDSCTVTISGKAPNGGFEVALTSDNGAVTVPTMIAVPAKASSVEFMANIAPVTANQTVTLTSVAKGVNKTFALKLSPGATAGGSNGPKLSLNSSSVTFGNVAVGTPSTQTLTLSSTGSSAVTVSSVSLTGTGFTDSGATFPLTLNAGKSATLNLQFAPIATGTQSGNLTITSNSAANGSLVIPVSGTGIPLQIALNWDAPTGTSVSGYNVYRATGTGATFQKLNASTNSPVSYMDSAVKANTTYQYYVTSIDTAGAESAPSNTATVVVP